MQVNPGTVAADARLSHSDSRARERLSVDPDTCGTEQGELSPPGAQQAEGGWLGSE